MHFFHSLFSLVGFAVTVAGALFAFGAAREYVRNRLRFVDAVRNPLAPWIVFLAATVVLLPVVALLPLVGFGTALVVGGGAGVGTASGVKALKRGE
jgi:hypothetical protein